MITEQLASLTTDQKVPGSTPGGITKGNKAGKPRHQPLPKRSRQYRIGKDSKALYKIANRITNQNGLGFS